MGYTDITHNNTEQKRTPNPFPIEMADTLFNNKGFTAGCMPLCTLCDFMNNVYLRGIALPSEYPINPEWRDGVLGMECEFMGGLEDNLRRDRTLFITGQYPRSDERTVTVERQTTPETLFRTAVTFRVDPNLKVYPRGEISQIKVEYTCSSLTIASLHLVTSGKDFDCVLTYSSDDPELDNIMEHGFLDPISLDLNKIYGSRLRYVYTRIAGAARLQSLYPNIKPI